MKAKLILLLLSIFSLATSAQNNNYTITIEELKDHIYYLASDELQGRFPGEPGFNKAAEYAVTQFKQAGLKPVVIDENGDSTYYQKVPVEKIIWDKGNTVSISNKNGTTVFKQNSDFAILCGRPFDQEILEGKVVFVSAGIREPEYGFDNYANVDVNGKWAVIYTPVDWLNKFIPEEYLMEKYVSGAAYNKIVIENAIEAGALGVIRIFTPRHWPYFKRVSSFNKETNTIRKTKGVFYDYDKSLVVIDSLPVVNLFKGTGFNPAANDTIYQSFELPGTTLKLNKKFSAEKIETYNVVGLLDGSSPELQKETLTVGAHLDHLGIIRGKVANGADDNASGSAALIEIAEELSFQKAKRPVLFILYTAEEMGLLGSNYFIHFPPVPIENIKVNINVDMIGRIDGPVEKGLAPLHSNNILKNELINVHQKYPSPQLDFAYAEKTALGMRSDHYPFQLKNIPVVYFKNGLHRDYHKPSDEIEKIDFEFLQKNTEFIYYLVRELANKEKLMLKENNK